MKSGRLLICGLLAIGLCAVLPPGALAGGQAQGHGYGLNSGIVNPNSQAYGSSYAELAAEWLQWALGIPATQNPMLDEIGEWAAVGQHGPVWFLAGNWGGATVRDCVVPAGVPLFFPVVNAYYFKTEPEEPCDRQDIRRDLRTYLKGATASAEIDGVPVEGIRRYFAESPLVDVSLPPDGIHGPDYVGPYGPSMCSGYFLLLEPLSAGPHTVHFQGTIPYWDFELEVTYNLTVVPNSCATHDVGHRDQGKR